MNYTDCKVLVRINKQSPDIAGGAHVGEDDLDVGAGDRSIMLGYASDETEDAIPLTHSMATRLGKKSTDVRKNGRPDGMTEVAIEYVQRADGSVEPRNIHYLYGDKIMAVTRQGVDVLSRGVPPPGSGDVGFDSSPYLATKHTICELCLPSVDFCC